MKGFVRRIRELRRYPSAIGGMVVVGLFLVLSIYAVIALPYSDAIRLWRGSPDVLEDSPRRASPVWYDLFTRERLPRTIVVTSAEHGTTTVEPLGDGTERVEIVIAFEYPYDGFPKELSFFTRAEYEGPRPQASISWRNPEGDVVMIAEDRRIRRRSDTFYMSQDRMLRDRLPGAQIPHVGLFSDLTTAPGPDGPEPIKGEYELVFSGVFPEGSTVECKFVAYGQIHGLAGTDHRRRDITVALLWGAPLALVFGVLGAIGANLSTFVLAGIGTWYGGRLDGLFQRITEVNLILPVLPILMMIGHFYSRSLWLMLGMIILLNVFSAAMKTYRAMFLQAKEAPYIEAAQAYGASNFRIVFRYLLPRIAPTLLPQFVLVIPTFVFLEASLAVLGLGDPVLPTWGKLLNDAWQNDALWMGQYYWAIQPALLLMFTGFGFALVGNSLDRVFNPRLRGV